MLSTAFLTVIHAKTERRGVKRKNAGRRDHWAETGRLGHGRNLNIENRLHRRPKHKLGHEKDYDIEETLETDKNNQLYAHNCQEAKIIYKNKQEITSFTQLDHF